jgi:hypothetical protein
MLYNNDSYSIGGFPMKKTALILALGASVAASLPAHAEVSNVKLATALVGTGLVTIIAGQCGKWAYDNGKFKEIAKFCLKNPWYPMGAALITTGAALLYKDAIHELLAPVIEFGREFMPKSNPLKAA